MGQKFWGLLFGVVLAAAFVLTAVSPWLGWWLPAGVASYSKDIDFLYYVILYVIAFFFVATEAVLVYSMLTFGTTPGRKAAFVHGNHRLELIWTIVPGIILFGLAVFQINVWAGIKYPTHLAAKFDEGKGDDYLQMEVTTRQWEFRIRYASPKRMAEWANNAAAKSDFEKRLPPRHDDVLTVNDLHTWKGQKTVVYLKTRDVGHSFFVPVLRVKQDSLPGRTLPLWFEAIEANTLFNPAFDVWHDGFREEAPGKWVKDDRYVWDLVCTQYCGTRHSLMRGRFYVHPTKEDYLKWLEHAQRESDRTQPEAAAKKD